MSTEFDKEKGIRSVRAILLIVIDCLRADHVSCYGYDRATTPTIDALAAQGILWEQAHAVSSWTKPSVTSLLTGLYPTQHGAFRGIKRSKGRTAVKTDVLRSLCPTIAERLTQTGWRCGAFINNAQLGEFTGLNRGFATYIPTAGNADRLIGLFLEWLEADLEKPVFAYLHFLEAHWPYKPRRRHVAMFGGNRDTNHFRDYSARDYGRLRRAISRKEATLEKEHLDQMIQMYDASIRRIDGKLKIILAMLTELGLRDETAVIVTADHGDEFLEHGQIGHGQSLYNELTHVPLVANIPGFPVGARYDKPVCLVDMSPTLLGLAGVDGEPATRDLLRSSGASVPMHAELSVGRRYLQTIRTETWKLHRQFVFEPSDRQADTLSTPWEQVAGCPHRTSTELYNMDSDPHEQKDVGDDPAHAKVRAQLLEDLDRWWQKMAVSADAQGAGEVEMDPRVVERLRDLGYLE